MGDRSWNNYSRAYDSVPRYTSSSGSSGNAFYTRSGDHERSHDNDSSAYTRSSSGRYSGNSRDRSRDNSYRNKYVDHGRGHHNNGVRRDYHHSSSGRSYNDNQHNWRTSRERPLGVPRNFHHPHPPSERSENELKSSWPNQVRRSRSPSAYINPSPPRRPSHRDRLLKSPSPPRTHGTTSRAHADLKSIDSYSDREKPKTDYNNFRGTDRRQRESSEESHSKFGPQGTEIDKLRCRLKEYVPWLTSRKVAIFEYSRDKELKQEVDNIDYCLDVIQEIKSNENVGMLTLNRAQEMVISLIKRGPITPSASNVTITIADSDEDLPQPEGVSREEYSARSPSPQPFDGIQFSRVLEDSGPKVIPMDRDQQYSSVLSMFPPSMLQDKLDAQRAQLSRLHRAPTNCRDDYRQNSVYGSTNLSSSIPRSIPFEREPETVIIKTELFEEKVFDYGHGTERPTLNEALFDRREQVPDFVPINSQSKMKEAETFVRKADEERRMREWEDSSEDEAVPTLWDKQRQRELMLESDVRDDSDSMRMPERAEETERFIENIRSPEPEEVEELKMYGFTPDMINPFKPTSHVRPLMKSLSPVRPQPGSIRSVSQPPQCPVLAQSQQVPHATLPMMNIHAPMFNHFSSSASAQMMLQRQAQLLLRFPAVAGTAAGLLPLPPGNLPVKNSPSPNLTFPSPNAIGMEAINQAAIKEAEKKEEEIMLSRIKARAAESFNSRNKSSGFGRGFGNHGVTTTTFQADQDTYAQPNLPVVPPMGPPAQVLDPRLKPRQPREFFAPKGVPRVLKHEPEPIPEPELVPPKPESTDAVDLSDSDTDLKIDLSHNSDPENSEDEKDRSPARKRRNSSNVSTPVEDSPSSLPLAIPEVATARKPEPVAPEQGSLPAAADELIKTLLFKSLSAEEAEVLNSSEDYLATTLARVKEELSAKVKERTRQMSGDSTESCVSSTTLPGAAPDARHEDLPEEESKSRGRTLRRKPPGKRRSSLEKLHDALREMKFDSMLPLGPRRAVTRTPNEDPAQTESTESEKTTNPAKIAIPKLSPAIVVLENCDHIPVATASKTTARSPVLHAAESKTESMDMAEDTNTTRRYPRRKTAAVVTKTVNTRSAKAAVSKAPSPDKGKTSKQGPPANKKRKVVAEKNGAETLPKIQSEETLEVEPNMISDCTKELKLDSVDNDAAKAADTELMDLWTDWQNAPTDFELPDGDTSLYKSTDFDLDLNDDDLPNFKCEDIDICSDDFIIDEAGLEAITSLNATSLSPEKSSLVEATNKLSDNVVTMSKPVKRKKHMARGVSQQVSCAICEFSGTSRKLVDHYVNRHPAVTIPLARLTEKSVKILQELNESNSPQLMEVRFSAKDRIRCIFCNILVSSISVYCQHLTGHTGEYRFTCSVCNIKFYAVQQAILHCKTHKRENLSVEDCLVETKLCLEEQENEFYSYMCRECGYFQINSDSIRAHLDSTKHCETDVACIKFKGIANKKGPKLESRPMRGTGMKSVPKSKPPSPTPPMSPLIPPVSSLVELLSVFPGPESCTVKEPPKADTAEVTRYVRRRNIIHELFEVCENSILSLELQDVGENVEIETLVTEQILVETENDIEIASNTALEHIIDVVCRDEEIETEFSNCVIAGLQSEAAFSATPVPMEGSLSIRNLADGSCSPYCCAEESVEELEPNDYYGDAEDTSSESELYSDGEYATDAEIPEDVQRNSEQETPKIDPQFIIGPLCPNIPSLMVPSPDSAIFRAESPTSSISSSRSLRLTLSPNSNPTSQSQSSVRQIQEAVVVDLEGSDLYSCGNPGCSFSCLTLQTFKAHNTTCKLSEPSRGSVCAHCDKRIKTLSTFYEHLNRHGKPNLWCALCSFKGRHTADITRHFKICHKYFPLKVNVPILPVSCGSLWFPKQLYERRLELKQMQSNPLLYVRRIEFLPNEIEDIPKHAILVSEIHCALCEYSTKVRRNMIRHLNLHKWVDEPGSGIQMIGVSAPVNPVPWMERKEMMFDKMTNLAGSSHKVNGNAATSVKEKLPQFVDDQFRYVCSVPSCAQITVDDTMLKAHMRALHCECDQYQCPHCQRSEATKFNPLYTVPIEKLGAHLKLHGPKLLKCRHCDFMTVHAKFMEKHLAEKHSEFKASHFMIRGFDEDAGASGRIRISGNNENNSSSNWKCASCKITLKTWELAKQHIYSVHKTKSQFMCDSCQFHTDSIFQLAKHIEGKECVGSLQECPSVFVLFSRNESGEENVSYPFWRRVSSREHLRGIYYLQEHEQEVETTDVGTSSKASPASKLPLVTVPKPNPMPKLPSGIAMTSKPPAVRKLMLGPNSKLLLPSKSPFTSVPKATTVTKVGAVPPKVATVSKAPSTIAPKPSIVPVPVGVLPMPAEQLGILPGRRKQCMLLKRPSGSYVCCKCGTYKTRLVDAMKTHLRQHLNYHRYTCRVCGYRAWTMSSFKLHVESDHCEVYNANKYLITEPRNTTVEKQMEKWMAMCLQDPLAPDDNDDNDEQIIFVSNPDSHAEVINPTETKPSNLFCEEILILD